MEPRGHNVPGVICPQPTHPVPGAVRQQDGSVLWTVWAPFADQVDVVTFPNGDRHVERMIRNDGYHQLRKTDVPDGMCYFFKLGDDEYSDPATRWQPDGVHKPSAVFTPEAFRWSDLSWTGINRADLILYELHVGTFTPEGTFDAVIPRLPELKTLGVTAIEIMPVGQFPGRRNWGYDGVHPYAVQNTYGGPRGLQRLVNAAHAVGLAVILDVVYNHFGPEGNYLDKFGPYFTDAYHTPWGSALNFDGPDCDPVRQFVIENARMWVRDFHCDGLRLDAVHAIYDFGALHILSEIREAVQNIAHQTGRKMHLIAESDQNNPRFIDPPEKCGFGLDAVWADEFHHSIRSLIAGDQQGYFQAFGKPEHLAQALEQVFVYDGCYSPFRRRRHGAPVGDRDRTQFVVCIHNHDQIGNRALGDRSSTYLSQSAQRLMCGLLMLSPCTPMLFMGEEYAETNPFPFFCSFSDAALIEAVRKGRQAEFADLGFTWGEDLPDPHADETFQSAVLRWEWPEGSFHAHLRLLFQELLSARKSWPPLLDRQHTSATVFHHPGSEQTILLIKRGTAEPLRAFANLSPETQPLLASEIPGPSPSPILSTEEQRYGGERDLHEPIEVLLPYELLIDGRKEWRR